MWASRGFEPLGPAGLYDTFGPELSFGRVLSARLSGGRRWLRVHADEPPDAHFRAAEPELARQRAQFDGRLHAVEAGDEQLAELAAGREGRHAPEF